MIYHRFFLIFLCLIRVWENYFTEVIIGA